MKAAVTKTELHVVGDQTFTPDAKVVEVWYEGKLIATVVGADGPGLRILSSYGIEVACRVEDVLDITIQVQ